MIRHAGYARERFARVAGELRALVHPETLALDSLLLAGPVGRISHDEARRLEYRPAALGERLGPLFATYWLRGAATIPASWAGRRVELLWDSGGEATLWLDGRPAHGLNPQHAEAVLADEARPGALDVEVEIACNGLFGAQEPPAELRRCELALFDPEAWRRYLDFEMLRALEAESGNGLDPSLAGDLREQLSRFCAERDDAILAGLLARRNGSRVHELRAIGHAHLDTAWLWPLAESRRKAVRTFATQLRLMDEYPEHRFACSQAQHYAWIEEADPELFERIREQVAAGRWVPVGGSWIEPDCNLPSGESLVRQLLHGQRYFESRFGRRCRELWSPDAFGYNAQLPQLLRGAGMTRFLTQKLSWSRFTRPEHHTFVWQGLDGSEVLAHFPPADTYNSDATVAELRRAARAYADHEHSATSLLVFGFGDGGGGPTREMLETLRRARDLQGVPRTRLATSDGFFGALEAEPRPRPVVVGELYLEYHRGTYTSQARVKRGNRRCERALHDAEALAAAALRLAGAAYPAAELDALWKLLLLNQFHDVLPGSSIREVNEEAERDLAEVERRAEALAEAALAALVAPGDELVPVNTTGVARREPVDGVFVAAPPYGFGAVVEPDDAVTLDALVLENAHLRAELSPGGQLVSLVHRPSGRETLAAPGNRLELYEDRPVAFDAWDIDPFHLDTRNDCPPAESWSVAAASPLRCELAFEHALGRRSRLRQRVRLDAGARRLEFHAQVDWEEEHTLLKVCFPLAVRALAATYEIQFGCVERPTHFSTSADAARYEVPGRRFADLSEHGFGAALLTDCKHGYSCLGNELRASLLRASRSPDPEADRGRHTFAYALYPHAGGWREGGVVSEATRFETPLRLVGGTAPARSLLELDDPNLVLDTVKRAEDPDALVLRLYEAHGARGTARLRLGLPFARARRASLLEDGGEPLAVAGDAIELPYLPHEVLTVKLE